MQLRFDDEDLGDQRVQAFLARVPEVRAKHAALGLTEDESWATLRTLPRHARLDRISRGEPGLFDLGWIEMIWTGKLAELGRLQFEDHGEGVLDVHIPETGDPLDPDACDASFRRAREVYPNHRTAICTSWLLDRRLADVLPAGSNIVRFQRRFELVAEGGEANDDVLRFVFHTYDPDLDKLVPRTTLERGLVAYMRAGRQWRAPTGRMQL